MLSSTNSRHTPRKRVSSTPRLLGSITDGSGILDRPVKPGDDDWGVAYFDAVIASEAKQSIARATVTMDCFVAALLAMTAKQT